MLALILYIAILGAVLYLIEAYVPMAPPFKILLRVIVVFVIVYQLLRLAGQL